MIGIVTVLYNSAPVLKDFFKSLNNQTFKDFILYVIDNKSSDNSLNEASTLSKTVSFKCVILPQEENWGVAKGNNIGIKAALNDKCCYVLLSNNDIVLEDNTIEELYLWHIKNKASLSVPKIYYWNTPQIIWAAGGFWHLSDCTSRHFGRQKPDNNEYGVMKQVEYAPSCFMLVNSDVFERVGYMDENFYVYYDDADFVWRSIIDGEEKLFYIPTSIVWHKVSFCTGGDSEFGLYYVNRNRIYFAFKHLSTKQKLVLYLYLISHYLLRDLYRMTKNQRKTIRKGIRDGFKMVKKFEHN